MRRVLLSLLVPLSLLLGATAQAPAPATAQAAGANVEAEQLIRQALEALDKRDIDTASPLLDQAKLLNDTQKNLWGASGALSLLRGDRTDAIEDYRKELALHPDSKWVWKSLSDAQVLNNRRDDALATLRSWTAAAPDDPASTIALVNALLLGDGHGGNVDAAGALAAANKGFAALPEDKRDNPALLFALGKAQLTAGERDTGAATLVKAIGLAQDPFTMNNAAYELANANKELPLAERTERKALQILSAVTRTWTLDENPAALRQRTSLVVSSWDTLGWILYREGRYSEALDFLRAAWVNAQHSEVGEHLGDIYDKMGNHSESWKTYQLALATIPVANSDSKRLQEKSDGQKKAGTRAEKLDAPGALVRLRTMPLGAAGGNQGAAAYLVLLSRDRVEKAKPTGEKSVAGGVELIEKGDVSHYTPISFDVRLARQGTLNCHANICEFVFEP